MNFLHGLLACGACAGLAPCAVAQQYPDKPIRVIAPGSVGGPADVIARIVVQSWARVLGQQMVIDNRAGAAGLIGTETVARAMPDGYTLLFGFSGPLVIVPQINAAVPYDTLKDFAPISLAATAPYVLLVRTGLQARSVRELVALARARPGKLNFASGGRGTGIHMAGELFNLAANIRIAHIPYAGAGPGMTALLAAEVDMMFNGLSPALPHIKSARLHALAVGSDKRSPLAPDLPTIAESGYKFNASGWYGPLAPAGTSPATIAKLHDTLVRALLLPQTKEQLNDLGVEISASTPHQYAQRLREELALWSRVVAAAGFRGQRDSESLTK